MDTEKVDYTLDSWTLYDKSSNPEYTETPAGQRVWITQDRDNLGLVPELAPGKTYQLSYSVTRYTNGKDPMTVNALKVFKFRFPYWTWKALPTFLGWLPFSWKWEVTITTKEKKDEKLAKGQRSK